MKKPISLTVIILLLAASNLSAATLYVSLESTNPTPPYTNWVTAATNIQQAVDAAEAGDTVLVMDGRYALGERATFDSLGSYLGADRVAITSTIALLSVNGPQYTVIDGGGTTQCVFLTNGASLTGFTLTNGYRSGIGGGGVGCTSVNAVLTNCLIIDNWAENGGGAYGGTLYNCTLRGNSAQTNTFYMDGVGGGANGSVLYNCTLTGNVAKSGGGTSGSTLYNCTLAGNSAVINLGGGAAQSTLYNCTLTGNSAYSGGGAGGGTLYNCTLTENSARAGGGAFGGPTPCTLYNCTLTANTGGGVVWSTLYNCIVAYNTASGGANYDPYGYSTLNYCCTTPMPTNGVGNIADDPLFVNYDRGNLRLQSNSRCINAGNNAYVSTSTDLDGRPRIVGGTVDMGAYEFQPGVSGAFIGWLQQYGLPTDGSADYADTDADGMNNWQEWVCGTDPTNRLSALRLLSPSITSTNVTVTWQSVAGVDYFLERSASLAAPFMLLATNILGQAGATSYADTNAAGKGPSFYRVGIRSP